MNIRLEKTKQLDIIQIISLTLLLFASMNFMNYYYYLCCFSFIIFIILKRKFFVNIDGMLLLLFGIFWLFFSTIQINGISDIVRPFLFLLMYIFGLNFINNNISDSKRENTFKLTIIVLALGPCIHFILNWIYNIETKRIIYTLDIWTKSVLSATGQAGMACMMVGILSAVIYMNIGKLWKAIAAVIFIIIHIYNLILGGRTLLLMSLLCIIASFVFLVISNKRGKDKRKIIINIFIIVIVVYLCYCFNLFRVQEFVANSGFHHRFLRHSYGDIFNDTRAQSKILYIQRFQESLFGGAHLRESGLGYAHDILLDTYDEAGIFSLFIIIIYLVRSILRVFKFITNEIHTFDVRIMVFSLYVAISIEFCIEPILQGLPWLFAIFCFIDGMIANANINTK